MTRLLVRDRGDAPPPSPAAIEPLARHGPGQADRLSEAREALSGPPAEYRSIVTESGRENIPVIDSDAGHLAASRLGAWSYTVDGAVVLGAGVSQPGGPTRDAVLTHELRHAAQMRKSGQPSRAEALEAEASGTGPVRLTAESDEPLGLYWAIAIGVGLYILFRPNVANAPGPQDHPEPSVTNTQVAGEAIAIFAPGAFTVRLARMGLGVVGAFAATGAMSSVGYRGVQDVSGDSFSGATAYVIDAGTGAVVGMFIGGVFRMTPAGQRLAAQAAQRPALTHFTNPAAAASINAPGSTGLSGRTGIWALEATAEAETPLLRAVRGTIGTGNAQAGVRIPPAAVPEFSQPFPIGPYSAYQNLMGVYRAPAGVINMTSGAFTPTGRVLPNLAGRFIPYGADMLIWLGAGAVLSQAPTEQDPNEIRRRRLLGGFGVNVTDARQMSIGDTAEVVEPRAPDAGTTFDAGGAPNAQRSDSGGAAPAVTEIVIVVDASTGFDPTAEILGSLQLPAQTPDSGSAMTDLDARARQVVTAFGANPEGESRDRMAVEFSTTYFPGHYETTQRETVRQALVRAGMNVGKASEAANLLN